MTFDSSKTWHSVPGYEGFYWITTQGDICNSQGHLLKHIKSAQGDKVELRKLGQREKLLVSDLVAQAWIGDKNETI